MGRPSKLSPAQWREIERRAADGESGAALAREYAISEAAVSKRVSKVSKELSKAARKLAEGKLAVSRLPVQHQYRAESLADSLVSMSRSLASAGDLGAKTAHRLQALANSEVEKVDDSDPLESIESLKSVGVLTKLANDSSLIARDLLAANKNQGTDAEDVLAQYTDEQLIAIWNGS